MAGFAFGRKPRKGAEGFELCEALPGYNACMLMSRLHSPFFYTLIGVTHGNGDWPLGSNRFPQHPAPVKNDIVEPPIVGIIQIVDGTQHIPSQQLLITSAWMNLLKHRPSWQMALLCRNSSSSMGRQSFPSGSSGRLPRQWHWCRSGSSSMRR